MSDPGPVRPDNPSLAQLVDETPPDRDRYVDFLRAFSICVVVLGHWLLATIWWSDDELRVENALALAAPLRWATWVLQVMPLFFFVGGFSHSVTIASQERRGWSYTAFLRGRVARLVIPSAVLVGVWMLVLPFLDVAGIAAADLRQAGHLVVQPLWFLAVYLAVVALAPPALWLHRRYRATVPVALAAFAAVLELAGAGAANYVVVFLFAHQLGFFYADGRITRRHAAGLAVAGLAALAVLTGPGPYPTSMVGGTGEATSNMSPPSVAIVALTVWQVGAAMLLRPLATRWLAHRRVWAATVAVNSVILTLFLWHLTALVVAVGVVTAFEVAVPEPTTAAWWLSRPVWVLVIAMLTAPLVLTFGFAERTARAMRTDRARTGRPIVGALATVALAAAFGLVAAEGLTPLPRLEVVAGVGLAASGIAALFARRANDRDPEATVAANFGRHGPDRNERRK